MAHVEGFLLSQSPDGLRLLLSHSAVVVSNSNVESVEILNTMPLPNELKAVRVYYRDEPSSAPGPGRSSGGLMPFAMATRRKSARVFDSPQYRAMEANFLGEGGLAAAGTDG